MRVAIYARMSTDKQADTSPEEQVARCRDYVARQGWQVVEDLVVSERGISGARGTTALVSSGLWSVSPSGTCGSHRGSIPSIPQSIPVGS